MKLATWHHRLPRCIRTYCSFAWINPFNGALCIRQTRTPTLCIRRTLSVDVTIGTPMVIFAVLLSFDCFWRLVHCTMWYTVLVHCTNSQKQSKPFVYQSSQVYQDCTNSVPIVKTVKNSQKTVKTAKMTIGVPIVTGLPRLYQQCNNSLPIVNKNLAIANRSRVSCARNTSREFIGLNITPWPWNLD